MASEKHLSSAIERNIKVLKNMRTRAEKEKSAQDKIADKLTGFSGSMTFLWLHAGWFGFWILANLEVIPGLKPFDPFPFGLLTMIVSLEAIFLSTIVMISQNREADLASRKEAMDLTIDLLSEYEVTHMLRLMRRIAHKLEIEDEDDELEGLCEDTMPEMVMKEIEALEKKGEA